MECLVALGSNEGDRMAHLRAAAAGLRRLDAAAEFSPVFETAPVDCPPGSGVFLNAAAVIRWAGTPSALHTELRALERAAGRPDERSRHAPRALDLDLILAGDAVSADAALTLPHPRFHERGFVLAPMAALRPGLVPPGFPQSLAALLAELPADGTLHPLPGAAL